MNARPVLQRLPGIDAAPIAFTLDGVACSGRAGDSVLTAVLTQGEQLRLTEFSASPRAGFCLMGACQDCWMDSVDGRRLRACSTPLEAGMQLLTGRRA
ncbi:MAG: (2Fe-2S)-binding protein [Rubrivivax sp.]|jgi:predicted molibdopterin-dependent oxidoreductase YjgC|nr:(2Fe-2S)-binding protein [Rubrivivax sp.]MBK7264561.1 (2Fe-2S)-binding protein [Rubrivivax sp.]MBK8529979.1 (2Fe-2S)-binding protein [Rubrivivax sp.]